MYQGLKQARKTNVNRRRGQRSGVILMLACFCMPMLMGLMAVAIDASVLYSVKTRLQMAVDGAAIAGLRAVSLAQTSSSQITMATNIATTWFNANFAGGYLGASGTVLSTPTLDTTNSNITVTVTATTQAPSYFMKYWNKGATTISASGKAGRRSVNLMMVLDRSASMGSGSGSACAQMVTAAKQFTGMFTPGSDNIGLVAFASAVQIVSSPTTSFQSTLGYSNSSGSTTGALDNISCVGGTNTSAAISYAWNELYKMQLPGAFNVVLLFTDGLPTAGSFNFKVAAAVDPTGTDQTAILNASNCQDSTGKTNSGGGNHVTNPRNWIGTDGNVSAPSGSGKAVSLGTNTYWSPFYGEIAGLYADATNSLQGGMPIFVPSGTPSNFENTQKITSEAPNCAFAGASNTSNRVNFATDIGFVPPVDMFGTSTSGYKTVTKTTIQSAQRIGVTRANLISVMGNLADNAATWARRPVVSGTLVNYANGVQSAQTTFFVIGLGSNGGVDHDLLQRIANDPNGDPSGNNNWDPMTPFANQPVGYYYYAPSNSDLASAFSKLGSSTLRLAQ